jgi:uncharacterized protein YbaR (Trm112 family)
MAGPRSGPQPNVKLCPACSGALKVVPSEKEPVAANSHHYECTRPPCKRSFEINEL